MILSGLIYRERVLFFPRQPRVWKTCFMWEGIQIHEICWSPARTFHKLGEASFECWCKPLLVQTDDGETILIHRAVTPGLWARWMDSEDVSKSTEAFPPKSMQSEIRRSCKNPKNRF